MRPHPTPHGRCPGLDPLPFGCAAPITVSGRVAVIQPLPGIGDMVWHLSHLAAIARHAPGGQIVLVGRPGARASELLQGSGLLSDFLPMRGRRHLSTDAGGLGALAIGRALRRRGVDTAILLHHGRSLAAGLFAAGIPWRLGYGARGQRMFLNHGPHLTEAQLAQTPFWQATQFITACGWFSDDPGAIPLEPRLPQSRHAVAAVDALLAGRPTPLVVLGIGSSEPHKQWGEANFAALCQALHQAGWPCIALAGGAPETAMLARLAALPGTLPLPGLPLDWLAELLRRATVFIGNDTGTLNLAAAVDCLSYGLFGGSDPITHTSRIQPILPPSGRPSRQGGMHQITPATVLRQLPPVKSVARARITEPTPLIPTTLPG